MVVFLVFLQMDLLLDMFHNEVEWQEGRKLASHLQAFHEFLVMRCLLPVDKHDVQENKSDHQSWSSRLVERLREWKKVGAMEQLSDHHGKPLLNDWVLYYGYVFVFRNTVYTSIAWFHSTNDDELGKTRH